MASLKDTVVLFVQELAAQGFTAVRVSRSVARMVAMCVLIVLDYWRAEQAAAAPKISSRDGRGDRATDIRADFITRGYDIERFYRAYFEVKRGRGEELQIGIRTPQHVRLEVKKVLVRLDTS